jgi:hypothetical protein
MVHVILQPPDLAGAEVPTADLVVLQEKLERLGVAGHVRVDEIGHGVVVTLFIPAKTLALAEFRATAACRGILGDDERFAGWSLAGCVTGFPHAVYDNLEDWE